MSITARAFLNGAPDDPNRSYWFKKGSVYSILAGLIVRWTDVSELHVTTAGERITRKSVHYILAWINSAYYE